MKKKIIISIIVIIVLLGVAGIGINVYSDYREEKVIETSIEAIIAKKSAFESETDRETKLTILKELEEEYKVFQNSEDIYEEVNLLYEETIVAMQTYFKDGYYDLIVEKTLLHIESVEDKELINQTITDYKELLNLIKTENVCNEAEIESHEVQINALITTYENRITEIEAAEEQARLEAEAQAEAERLAAEEAKKTAEEEAKRQEETTAASTTGNADSTTMNQAELPPLNQPEARVAALAERLGITNYTRRTVGSTNGFELSIIIDNNTGAVYDAYGNFTHYQNDFLWG